MFEVAMQKDGHEPPVDLKVILDFSAVLPTQDCQSMRVRSQEFFVIETINRARNYEDKDLEQRNDDDELPDADSRTEAEADAVEKVFISGLALIPVRFVVILTFFL